MTKSFSDLNLVFGKLSNCATCRDGYCSSTAIYSPTGEDYNVQIWANPEMDDIAISASHTSNVESNGSIEEFFTSESDAVKFICDNFSNFRCVYMSDLSKFLIPSEPTAVPSPKTIKGTDFILNLAIAANASSFVSKITFCICPSFTFFDKRANAKSHGGQFVFE